MRGCLLAALLCLAGTAATARDRPGDFDFYVLALSWSPSYCEAEGDRADRSQCSGSRKYEFVVHGLWPQYERGHPEFCDRSAPRIPQRLLDSMLDVMPSRRLVIHQWRKHGICADTDPARYFAELREARARISIPEQFVNLETWKTVSPGAVEAAFRTANPAMPAAGIAVTCDGRLLREVHICLDRNLEFRTCPEIDRRACRAGRVAMPPSR